MIEALAAELGSHLDRLRQHPNAAQALNDITQAVHQAQRAIDRPPARTYAGPCDCGTDLLTTPGRQLVTCPNCGNTYGIHERQEWLRNRLADMLMTATEAAGILPTIGLHVSGGTIRMWHHRGRLEPRFGIEGVAHPRYRLGDIITLCIARDTARTA